MTRAAERKLATTLGVSDRMIRKYVTDGMPQNPDGTFDDAACVAWKKQNKFPEMGNGGNMGGGRPAGIVSQYTNDEPTDPAQPIDLRQLKARQVESRIRIQEIEIAKQEGRLIDKDRALRAVRDHLGVVRQQVERIGPGAAKAVAAALGIGSENVDAVRTAIDGEVKRALASIADSPLTL